MLESAVAQTNQRLTKDVERDKRLKDDLKKGTGKDGDVLCVDLTPIFLTSYV